MNQQQQNKTLKKKKWPLVIAHRGASGYAPENTIEAIKKAHKLGVSWVEFDVMLCKDEAIIMHDEALKRTTNGRGRVIDFTYDEIVRLDAGSWFDPKFKNVRVPTFIQMIECLKQFHLSAVVELKSVEGNETETGMFVSNLMKQHWPIDRLDSIVSSFSFKILQVVKEQMPLQGLGLGLHEWNDDWRDQIEELNCISIHVNEKILNEKKVSELKATNRAVFAYTVNELDRAKQLFSWGVDSVFSDFPDRIIQEIS